MPLAPWMRGAPLACCPACVDLADRHSENRQMGVGQLGSAGGIVTAMSGDLLDANRRYQESFSLRGLEPSAGRGLAVVTCMDSRVEPLAMLGLEPGVAKIFRNAG